MIEVVEVRVVKTSDGSTPIPTAFSPANEINIQYSIDDNGNIVNANYANNSTISVKKGTIINLVGNISTKTSQRGLIDGSIMGVISSKYITTTSTGEGNIYI